LDAASDGGPVCDAASGLYQSEWGVALRSGCYATCDANGNGCAPSQCCMKTLAFWYPNICVAR
jgi:hypothetical protein